MPLENSQNQNPIATVNNEIDRNLGTVIGFYSSGDNNAPVTVVNIYNSERGSYEYVKGPSDSLQSPYKYLLPYTYEDKESFKRNSKLIDDVVKKIKSQGLLVVYGEAGVGKTSLFSAAVIPILKQDYKIFQLFNYQEPENIIRGALENDKSEGNSSEKLPQDLKFSALVKHLLDATNNNFVFVFDQFEMLFDSSFEEDQRVGFLQQLGIVAKLPEKFKTRLRIVMVVREEALAKVGSLVENIPEVLKTPYHIKPLSKAEAKSAILAPLNRLKQINPNYVSIDPGIEDLIATDLIRLQNDGLPLNDSSNNNECIYPSHLQIVCENLFQEGSEEGGFIRFYKSLYTENLKSADGILASYVKSAIDSNVPESCIDQAVQILSTISQPGFPEWTDLETLEFDTGVPNKKQIPEILNGLVRAKILKTSYTSESKIIYSFINPAIVWDVRRWLDSARNADVKEKVKNELERVWLTWLRTGFYASGKQLKYIAKNEGELNLNPVKSLLLLRSAVELQEPPKCWIEKLIQPNGLDNKQPGVDLIKLLEGIRDDGIKENDGLNETIISHARKIILEPDEETKNKDENLNDAGSNQPLPQGKNQKFESISEAAVKSKYPAVRQAGALSLGVLGPDKAVLLINESLGKNKGTWWRRAELLGVLAEAGVIRGKNKGIKSRDEVLIWGWRAWRNITRDYQRILFLMLGGLLGAGISRGFYSALFSPDNSPSGPYFANAFFVNGLLGAALTTGMALAIPLALRTDEEKEKTYPFRNLFATNLTSFLLALFLGTLFLTFAQIPVYWFNAGSLFTEKFLWVFVRGAILGFFLSLILSLKPFKGTFSNFLNLVFSTFSSAFVFAVMQWIFSKLQGPNVKKNQSFYTLFNSSFISETLKEVFSKETRPWVQIFKVFINDPEIFLICYAGLLGAFMAAGLILSLNWSATVLQKLQNSIRGAEENASSGEIDEK